MSGRHWFRLPEHLHLASTTSLNLMSYNVLSDFHVSSESYPSTSAKHLDFQHRVVQLLRRISREEPDIIALQEVDAPHLLIPQLNALGYQCAFALRIPRNDSSGVPIFHPRTDSDSPSPSYSYEGLLTGWRSRSWACVAQASVRYSSSSFGESKDQTALCTILVQLPSVLNSATTDPQELVNPTSVFHSDSYTPSPNSIPLYFPNTPSGRNPVGTNDNTQLPLPSDRSPPPGICICNTHLLFNHNRGDLKLRQVQALTQGVREWLTAIAAHTRGKEEREQPFSATHPTTTANAQVRGETRGTLGVLSGMWQRETGDNGPIPAAMGNGSKKRSRNRQGKRDMVTTSVGVNASGTGMEVLEGIAATVSLEAQSVGNGEEDIRARVERKCEREDGRSATNSAVVLEEPLPGPDMSSLFGINVDYPETDSCSSEWSEKDIVWQGRSVRISFSGLYALLFHRARHALNNEGLERAHGGWADWVAPIITSCQRDRQWLPRHPMTSTAKEHSQPASQSRGNLEDVRSRLGKRISRSAHVRATTAPPAFAAGGMENGCVACARDRKPICVHVKASGGLMSVGGDWLAQAAYGKYSCACEEGAEKGDEEAVSDDDSDCDGDEDVDKDEDEDDNDDDDRVLLSLSTQFSVLEAVDHSSDSNHADSNVDTDSDVDSHITSGGRAYRSTPPSPFLASSFTSSSTAAPTVCPLLASTSCACTALPPLASLSRPLALPVPVCACGWLCRHARLQPWLFDWNEYEVLARVSVMNDKTKAVKQGHIGEQANTTPPSSTPSAACSCALPALRSLHRLPPHALIESDMAVSAALTHALDTKIVDAQCLRADEEGDLSGHMASQPNSASTQPLPARQTSSSAYRGSLQTLLSLPEPLLKLFAAAAPLLFPVLLRKLLQRERVAACTNIEAVAALGRFVPQKAEKGSEVAPGVDAGGASSTSAVFVQTHSHAVPPQPPSPLAHPFALSLQPLHTTHTVAPAFGAAPVDTDAITSSSGSACCAHSFPPTFCCPLSLFSSLLTSPLLLVGDLNSTPTSPLLSLLSSAHLCLSSTLPNAIDGCLQLAAVFPRARAKMVALARAAESSGFHVRHTRPVDGVATAYRDPLKLLSQKDLAKSVVHCKQSWTIIHAYHTIARNPYHYIFKKSHVSIKNRVRGALASLLPKARVSMRTEPHYGCSMRDANARVVSDTSDGISTLRTRRADDYVGKYVRKSHFSGVPKHRSNASNYGESSHDQEYMHMLRFPPTSLPSHHRVLCRAALQDLLLGGWSDPVLAAELPLPATASTTISWEHTTEPRFTSFSSNSADGFVARGVDDNQDEQADTDENMGDVHGVDADGAGAGARNSMRIRLASVSSAESDCSNGACTGDGGGSDDIEGDHCVPSECSHAHTIGRGNGHGSGSTARLASGVRGSSVQIQTQRTPDPVCLQCRGCGCGRHLHHSLGKFRSAYSHASLPESFSPTSCQERGKMPVDYILYSEFRVGLLLGAWEEEERSLLRALCRVVYHSLRREVEKEKRQHARRKNSNSSVLVGSNSNTTRPQDTPNRKKRRKGFISRGDHAQPSQCVSLSAPSLAYARPNHHTTSPSLLPPSLVHLQRVSEAILTLAHLTECTRAEWSGLCPHQSGDTRPTPRAAPCAQCTKPVEVTGLWLLPSDAITLQDSYFLPNAEESSDHFPIAAILKI